MKFDVVIIGGSLAGSACARELRRRGVDAIALERERFPRPKVCGGFLSPNAVDCLGRLGVLDDVQAAGAVKVDGVRIHAGGSETEVPLRRWGLGISRGVLDDVAARGAPVRQGINVRSVVQERQEFLVDTDLGVIRSRILVDAAGKLSRFTARSAVPEFGIQYFDKQSVGSLLEFWFFDDGYGGGVGVENGLSNFCFLIRKDALGSYMSKPGRLCTGPLAYDRDPGGFISIGDARGMIDPFCGEGIHHALDSGITAAAVIARGIQRADSYAEMQQAYELEWSRRWSAKRLLAGVLRRSVRYPKIVGWGLRWNPEWFLNRLWDRIPS